MYKLLINTMTNQPAEVILQVENNTYIPIVEGNTDYQAYLAWLAEGNAPTPADEVTQ